MTGPPGARNSLARGPAEQERVEGAQQAQIRHRWQSTAPCRSGQAWPVHRRGRRARGDRRQPPPRVTQRQASPFGQVPVGGRAVPGEIAAGRAGRGPARGPSALAADPASRGPAQTPARAPHTGPRTIEAACSVARTEERGRWPVPACAQLTAADPLPQLGPGERPVGGEGTLDHPDAPFGVLRRDPLPARAAAAFPAASCGVVSWCSHQ